MKLVTVPKTTLSIFSSCVLLLLTSSFDSGELSKGDEGQKPIVRTVVIDPGHGGKDPGCSGRSAIEKEVALSISLKLGELITAHYPDVKVIYTRSTDVFVPLDERAQIANKAQADLFISIHCNYIPKRNHAQGSETYVMGLHRADDNLDVAKRENASILMEDDYIQKYDGYDPNSPEGHIILSMYQNAHLDQSILFADFVEKQFIQGLARKSRGVKQAGFVVLRNTTMPSVLIETGFLSHDNDESYLDDPENQVSMAQAIFNAFSSYKVLMEGNTLEADEPLASVNATEIPVQVKEQSVISPKKEEVVMPKSEEIVQKPAAIQPGAVTFYVQLAASRTPLASQAAPWKGVGNVEAKKENGYYKYLAGPFTESGQANALLNELRSGCCKDAFVVAYRDSQRITLAEAGVSPK
jgi:N-acetylmuramoyl-L-alanine amidase